MTGEGRLARAADADALIARLDRVPFSAGIGALAAIRMLETGNRRLEDIAA